MKNAQILKSLVITSFFIFTLPFLKTCSDERISSNIKTDTEQVIVISDSKKNEANKVSELKNIENRSEIVEKTDYTESFYSLIYKSFGTAKLNEYDKTTLEDKSFYPLLGFFVILIVSVLNLIFTLMNKFKKTLVLGIVNIVLLIFSTFGLVYAEIVENLNQIKIGYYLLALNLILIVIIARNENKKRFKTT